MAAKVLLKRTSVSGRVPNTSNLDTGELALNMTDGILYGTNGSIVFEIGANLTNLSVTGNTTFGNTRIVANGSVGTAGYVLTTGGSGGNVYWSEASSPVAGTNTQVQFNDSGDLGASDGFTFDKASNNLTVSNTVTAGKVTINNYTLPVTDGQDGYVISTNGSGTLTFTPGAGSGFFRDTYIGNGSNTQYSLSRDPFNDDHILVFVDRILQLNTDYTLVGSTLTFDVAPDNGSPIDVFTVRSAAEPFRGVTRNEYTGNGTNTQFTLAANSSSAAYTLVFVDTVFQPTTEYTIANNVITFNSAPADTVGIEVVQLGTGFVSDGITPPGSNDDIIFNDGGFYNANNQFKFNNSTTTLSIGSNVTVNTSTIFIGNSTVNTTITAGNVHLQGTQLTVGNVVVNGESMLIGNTTVHTTGLTVGNVTIHTTGITVGNSTVNTVLGATGTMSTGNTNIAGYINVSTNTATFGTAVYVVANGNVGVGTTSPSDKLAVEKGSISVGNFSEYPSGGVNINSTSSGYQLKFDNTYGSYAPKIVLYYSGNWLGGFGISGGDLDYFSGANHRFYTGSGTTVGAEKFTILSNGSIGISNSAPGETLVVNGVTRMYGGNGSTLAVLSHRFANGDQTRTFNIIAPASESGAVPFQLQTGNAFEFLVDSSSVLYLASDYNVGIGNTTPTHKFRVEGSASIATTLEAGNTTITGFANVNGNTTVTGATDLIGVSNTDGLTVYRAGGGSQYMKLNSNGGGHFVTFNSTNTNSKSALFELNTTGSTGIDNQFRFRIDGAEELKINSTAVAISADLIVSGNVFFNGTTTNVNSTNLIVEDKNIIIGDVATPTDVTADGGGITLKGTTDKTITWVDSTDAWTSSEDFNLVSGKSYEINGTVVVNSTSLGTGITGSSLTSVGTLTGLTVSGATNLQNTLAAGNTTITGFANVTSTLRAGGILSGHTSYITNINDAQTTTPRTIQWEAVGATAVDAGIAAISYSVQAGNQPYYAPAFYLARSKSGTKGTPGIVADTDIIGSIVFSGDDGTDFISAAQIRAYVNGTPGANNVPGRLAFLTTSTAETSAERMTIVANGNVGVGTTAPAYLVEASGGDGTTIGVTQSSGSGAADTGSAISLRIYDGSSVRDAGYIYSRKENSTVGNYASYLSFWTRPNGSSASERIRITSNGNVGIGTASPAAALHVSSLGSAKLKISADTDNVTEDDIAGIELSQDGGITTANFGIDSSNHLVLGVNSTTAPNIYIGTRSDGTSFVSATDAKITVLNDGNVGIATTTPAYNLEVNGSFAATTKSFVIDHPTKPGMKLRYGSLEGPENGVYARGKLDGENVIELPEYWTKLVDENTITVQLTSIGKHQKLFIEEISDNKVYISNDTKQPVQCFFVIFAERKDVDKLVVEY